MSVFDVTSFLSDPQGNLDSLSKAKKGELLSVAANWGLQVTSTAVKGEIRNTILLHCIDNDLVDEESARKYICEVKDGKSELECMKIALQVEQLKLESARFERERIEIEQNTELRLIHEKFKLKEQELSIEKAKLDHEAILTRETNKHKSELNVQEKQKCLELEIDADFHKFDLAKCLKLVPDFNAQEVDVFF